MNTYQSSLGVTITGGLSEEAAAERALPRKKSSKGLKQEQMVESFVAIKHFRW